MLTPNNILDIDYRKKVLEGILGEENKRRKVDSFKRLDIYKKNQRKYILDRILKDLSPQTVANMRTFTSINFTRKIIDAQASIYKETPKREWANASDQEKAQLDSLYKYSKANVILKKSNRYYKLEDQCALQLIPKDGCIHLRVLAPHHYDVIPNVSMPEKADAYIISGFNKQYALNDTIAAESLDPNVRRETTLANYHDNTNQVIADQEDYQSQLNYFVWWSDEYHFATNKSGEILDDNNNPYPISAPVDQLLNPIGKAPFIDIVNERDFEYWAQTGSNVTDLQLDLGAQISDTCDVNFRQGYSQAILAATEAPASMQVGPHTLLFLKKNPKAEPGAHPEFQFATPSPDLASSIRLTEMLLAMGLSSEGLEASVIATGPSVKHQKSYTSGYERLLAQLEEFKASQDDIDLFYGVEEKLFDLFKLWNNVLQNVTGPLALIPELQGAVIGDSVELDCSFSTPEMVQSQSEKEDSNIKLMEAGLRTRKRAVMEIDDCDEDKADETIAEIDAELAASAPDAQIDPVTGLPVPATGAPANPLLTDPSLVTPPTSTNPNLANGVKIGKAVGPNNK